MPITDPSPLERKLAFEVWWVPVLPLVRAKRYASRSRFVAFHAAHAAVFHLYILAFLILVVVTAVAVPEDALRATGEDWRSLGISTFTLAATCAMWGGYSAQQGSWEPMPLFGRFALPMLRALDARSLRSEQWAAYVGLPRAWANAARDSGSVDAQSALDSHAVAHDLHYHRHVKGRPLQHVRFYPPSQAERRSSVRMYVPLLAMWHALAQPTRSVYVQFHAILATLGQVAWLGVTVASAWAEMLIRRDGGTSAVGDTLRGMQGISIVVPAIGWLVFSVVGVAGARRGAWLRIPVFTRIAVAILFKRARRRAGLGASSAFIEWGPPPLRDDARRGWPGMRAGEEPAWLSTPRDVPGHGQDPASTAGSGVGTRHGPFET